MNPYDFVRTDWSASPQRSAPKLHHKFYPDTLSGKIECQLTAETLLFVPNSHSEEAVRATFSSHRNDYDDDFFIPGSSLKGMIRSLVEIVGNGCYSKFDGNYEKDKITKEYKVKYKNKLPSNFAPCTDKRSLCISCRLFGFLFDDNVYKGLVHIGDAEFIKGEKFGKFILPATGGPMPHHKAFYLNENEDKIVGRKLYFHSNNYLEGSFETRVIYPLKNGSAFKFKVHFTNLTQSELNTLLFALVLEDNIRHKIGRGKPLGLGSVKLDILELTLIDYYKRYSEQQLDKQNFTGETLAEYLHVNLALFRNNQSISLKDVRRIWRWPPPEGIRYEYPSYEWFREAGNSQVRLNQIV